ncbi:MAG: type III-B CRISPR module-associated protein Cmr3 [Firmicutes bacterium]|nr:type III-B CRISPR module-associated protein Cmr3 [Bacillota bacterium]
MNRESSSKTIRIEALDTLFFRDGRPFAKGEETWGWGMFPPVPSVLYGALRSVYFSGDIGKLPMANERNDPTGKLELTGSYISIENLSYFPLPLDCVQFKDAQKDEEDRVFVLNLFENNDGINSCPNGWILKYSGNRPVAAVEGSLISKTELFKYKISKTELFKYLKTGQGPLTISRISKHLKSEAKIGNALSRATRRAEDEMLYRVGMFRPKGLNLMVKFKGLEIPERGLMKLGGEGKAAFYERVENEDFSADIEISDNRFKLYFAAPAIFKKGWLPSWIDVDENGSFKGNYKGVRIRLLAAAVGKPLYVGGFDIKAKRPKPMFRSVPAGSVYYFQLEEGSISRVIDFFHNKTVSDYYQAQGFGWALIGRV